MIDRLAAALRPHSSTISAECTRDIPFQLLAALWVCSIVFWQVSPVAAVVVFGLILIGQQAFFSIFKSRFPFRGFSKDTLLVIALVLMTVVNILYLVPGLLLAQSQSLAIKLAALAWVLGVQIHIVNSWSRVAPFLFAQLVPAMVMTVLTIFLLPSTMPIASTSIEWGVVFVGILIFIYASVDSLRHHISTERALFEAQNESAERLTQLKENQRLDPLTDLLNRPAFDAALNVMLVDRQIVSGQIAVFLVDLDCFKPINDTYSHVAGDRVLMETASRLKTCIGDNGIVGRLGGDEYICAIPELDNVVQAIDLGNDIAKAINAPIGWNDIQLRISASVGISFTGMGPEGHADTVQSLCSSADQAMFAAKTSLNATPVLFERELFASSMTPLEKQALIDAILNNRIRPHYQPKVNLQSGETVGFEALARWHHPDGTLRRPDTFLEQIKVLGLQGEFMTCIAAQVVADVQDMLDTGLNPGQVSFNIPEVALATHSGSQDLKRIVTEHTATAQHLTFEITEGVFIARAADAIQTSIAQFRDLGVRISLDHFGTGFASFHHLSQLDFDELKIDTQFIAGLGRNRTSDVLVRGFLDIASGLGVDVIAEGVETEDQRHALIEMGCMTAQGHLFQTSLPLDQVKDLLSAEQAA